MRDYWARETLRCLNWELDVVSSCLLLRILLTDVESAQEIIQRNLEMCRTPLQGKLTVQVFDWSDLEPPMLCPDTILIVDCTYNNDCLAELVSTDTIIVLAHKRRHYSELVLIGVL